MEIYVTEWEAGWLHQAALLSQEGQTFEQAREARALGQRLAVSLPKGQTIRYRHDAGRNISIDLATHEIQLLHWHLANGTRWPFAQWSDTVMNAFGELIQRMAQHLRDARAKDAFDALPEAERQKALAQAKKEKQ